MKLFDFNKDGHGEHYWEMGCSGARTRQVLCTIGSVRPIKRNYYLDKNPYHYYIIF